MKVKDLCKLVSELRPDVDISVAGIFGKDINDRAWCYSTIYDSKPPNFENLVAKDKEVTMVEVIKDSKLNVETVIIYFDMDKKEKKMKTVKAPVKLPSILELFEDGEQIEICIMLKAGKYVYLHGEAETLRELDVIQGCFVVGIYTADPDTEEEGLYIRASKVGEEESK